MKLAAPIGFKTVIIDDGWQTNKPSGLGAYETAGDWQISKDKFYDFPKFVKDVHELGIKVMLWVAVPYLGMDTEAFKTYQDKLLFINTPANAGVIDPRYKECRDYVINSCINLVKDNNLLYIKK